MAKLTSTWTIHNREIKLFYYLLWRIIDWVNTALCLTSTQQFIVPASDGIKVKYTSFFIVVAIALTVYCRASRLYYSQLWNFKAWVDTAFSLTSSREGEGIKVNYSRFSIAFSSTLKHHSVDRVNSFPLCCWVWKLKLIPCSVSIPVSNAGLRNGKVLMLKNQLARSPISFSIEFFGILLLFSLQASQHM